MGWIDSEALWFWPKTDIQLGSEIPRPITLRYTNNLTGTNYRAGHNYIAFYNTTRPHSSLKAQTPDQVYFNRTPEPLAA